MRKKVEGDTFEDKVEEMAVLITLYFPLYNQLQITFQWWIYFTTSKRKRYAIPLKSRVRAVFLDWNREITIDEPANETLQLQIAIVADVILEQNTISSLVRHLTAIACLRT